MIITYFFNGSLNVPIFLIPFTRFNQPRKVTNAERDKKKRQPE